MYAIEKGLNLCISIRNQMDTRNKWVGLLRT